VITTAVNAVNRTVFDIIGPPSAAKLASITIFLAELHET
jgi:hypothetical protein